MRSIRIKDQDSEYQRYYSYDIARIVGAMAEAGYQCSRTDAERLWKAYSDSMAAGWMNLPEDNREIVNHVRSFFEDEGYEE